MKQKLKPVLCNRCTTVAIIYGTISVHRGPIKKLIVKVSL